MLGSCWCYRECFARAVLANTANRILTTAKGARSYHVRPTILLSILLWVDGKHVAHYNATIQQMLLHIHTYVYFLYCYDHFGLKATIYLCTFDNVILNQLNDVIDRFAANYSLDNYRYLSIAFIGQVNRASPRRHNLLPPTVSHRPRPHWNTLSRIAIPFGVVFIVRPFLLALYLRPPSCPATNDVAWCPNRMSFSIKASQALSSLHAQAQTHSHTHPPAPELPHTCWSTWLVSRSLCVCLSLPRAAL